MEQERNEFSHDQDNRIQKLYHDVNINTIFNKSKLRNLKNKFVKYVNYITKYEKNVIQPALLEYQKIEDDAHKKLNRVKFFYLHNPTPENLEKRKALFPIFRKAEDECGKLKCIAAGFHVSKDDIHSKINEINKQQHNIYKHYRKCSHCKNMNMVTTCGCKSEHKLCSDCSYDITECPVCEEDLGLQHCDICYEYKKELVDTGCENKHQTCKECLDKIYKNKKRRGLDHNIRNGYHRDSEPYYFKYKCPFCRGVVNIECGRDEYYNNYNDDDDDFGYADYESDEEFWRRDGERDVEEDRSESRREPVDPHPAPDYLMENGEDYRDYLQDMADDRRENRRDRRER